MRLVGCLALLVAGVGVFLYAAVPGAPWRPQARVLVDPAAWYSPALFKPMPKPGPGDWMAAHPEAPQSFEQYVASRPVRPTADRHTIYLCQVGPMKEADRKRFDVLREYMELYYTLPVKMGPPVGLENVTNRPPRGGDPASRQYLTTDLLDKVLPPLLPKDAVCLQGVTMEDLYPDPKWNYVFGQASLDARVGIYSLVRFYPAFWGEKETPESEQLGLWRSLQCLVHETGHMFGVHHCQKYECVMNGCNSLAESDRRPIHLCPDCLKKFRWNIGFGVIERYEALKKFYAAHDMKAEAEWVDSRIKECKGEKPKPDEPKR
jgi:archaemetzincin